MNVIAYTTSGLGNRLRPLAACYALSKTTGRNLLVYWNTTTLNGCLAEFNELFENELNMISLDEISQLEDCALFSEHPLGPLYHGVERERLKFGRDTLKKIAEKYGALGYNDYHEDVKNENVIIYHNNFIPYIYQSKERSELAISFIRNLTPVRKIRDKINKQIEELELDKSVIGVHARGTDFDVTVDTYIQAMNAVTKEKPDAKFLVTTEDKDFEQKIKYIFGDKVKVPTKDFYDKTDPDAEWADNFKISKSHAEDAVVDLYLLASTTIGIYHQESTYAQIARILS